MGDVLKGLEIKNMTDTTADLYFYGDIVSDWWGAWQNEDQYPDAIKNFLSNAEGKDLNVYVNSGGGSVFAGMAIYNMIKRHGEKNKVKVVVTVHVTVGSRVCEICFFVIRIGSSYNALLGRDWIQANKCVPSSMHQYWMKRITSRLLWQTLAHSVQRSTMQRLDCTREI